MDGSVDSLNMDNNARKPQDMSKTVIQVDGDVKDSDVKTKSAHEVYICTNTVSWCARSFDPMPAN